MDKKTGHERRKHERFPVIKNLVRPIELVFDNKAYSKHVPAILFDLSAGGMGLLCFEPITTSTIVLLNIEMEGLKVGPAYGKVVWAFEKGESWRVGINFTNLNENDKEKINNLARDYIECEMRAEHLEKDKICVSKCHYRVLCEKPFKIKKHN